VFYGGAAGGGKSDWLLMGALEHVDVPGYSAIIFRRTFTDLDLPGAIMDRSREWLANTPARWSEQKKKWMFPSGASLQFAFMKDEGDEIRYQGAEFQYVGFDELTQFPERQYTYLFSRLRRPQPGKPFSVELSKVPLRMRAASNPGGVGHGWVKDRFQIQTGRPRDDGRHFVSARIADNPYLDAVSYRKGLSRLDETIRLQLEEGNWDVFEGAAFVVTRDHLVKGFRLQDAFDRFEAADYGFNGAPWSLWATDYEGNVIAVDMTYGTNMLPSEVCEQIVGKRKAGWGFGHPAYMDPTVWKRTGSRNRWGRPQMLADEFSDAGVPVHPANNDPRAGLVRLRELLTPDPSHRFPDWHGRRGEPNSPWLFFDKRCEQMVAELRNAPLQPFDKRDGGEMVDPEWESRHGHSVAMARYAVMTKPSASQRPYQPLEDPRAELLRRVERQRQQLASVR
jgi:hypothetical protein